MNGISGIIFDLDGVLIHTDDFHYRAWKRVADRHGIRFDREINNRLRGVSRMESLEIILQSGGKALTEREKELFAEEKNNLYREYLSELTPDSVAPEVRALLGALKGKGYSLAVGSSSKNAGMILRNIGLYGTFDAICDGNHISQSKPHPEVFLKAALLLSLPPEQCIVIEDARAGVDAAVNGGFICFGIGDAADYKRSTYRLDSLYDLLTYLTDKNN
jgi:beta-phosphoglucomutase